MGNRYLTGLADWCRAAGLPVIETDGWQHRARSSGGYDGDRPWCVMWHHTASRSSPENDVSYIIAGSPDAPIANLYLARDGTVWICAGGATNTNGKGGPLPVSKGNIPVDRMNEYGISIEAANDGVGEAWSVGQVNAYFALSLALTANLGLATTDISHHHAWAPGRKIDCAVAGSVQGPWRPGSINSSGSWSMSDTKAELIERSGGGGGLPPMPPEPLPEEDEMLVVCLDANGSAWVGNGITRLLIGSPDVFDRYVMIYRERLVNTSGQQVRGWDNVGTGDDATIAALGFA